MKLFAGFVDDFQHFWLVLRQKGLHGDDIGRVRAEVDGVVQVQPFNQPLLLVQKLSCGAFPERAAFLVLVQPASGSGVQGPDEQEMGLYRVDELRRRVRVFPPQLRPGATEDRVEGITDYLFLFALPYFAASPQKMWIARAISLLMALSVGRMSAVPSLDRLPAPQAYCIAGNAQQEIVSASS